RLRDGRPERHDVGPAGVARAPIEVGERERPVLKADLEVERPERPALVRERRADDRPPAVDGTDDVRGRDTDLLEEEPVELAPAAELDERAPRHARAPHVDREAAEPAMLGRVGVRADEEEAPVREVRLARPDLLPRDDPGVAVADGGAAERRE